MSRNQAFQLSKYFVFAAVLGASGFTIAVSHRELVRTANPLATAEKPVPGFFREARSTR
jgi:hypothetical protein